VRDALDELLSRTTLLTIAAAIAGGYAVLSVAQGAAALVLSAFTEQEGQFDSIGGPLSLDVGDRTLEFGQLVAGVVTLAVVLAFILYVVRPDRQGTVDEELDEIG
jgi:hypothetical protein